MTFQYLPNGNLIVGIHKISWDEFIEEYGYTLERKYIIEGLIMAMRHLGDCGGRTIYINGSFVTKERNPNDFDACWDDSYVGMDFEKLFKKYRVLGLGSKDEQHLMYRGDIKPASLCPNWRFNYLRFFQLDKYDQSDKGIIELSLQ